MSQTWQNAQARGVVRVGAKSVPPLFGNVFGRSGGNVALADRLDIQHVVDNPRYPGAALTWKGEPPAV